VKSLRLAFVVLGHVQPYQRVSQRPIRMPTGKIIGLRNLTPKESRAYLAHVAASAQAAAARLPAWRAVLVGKLPVRIHLHVVRTKWLGDLDNLQKNILDGLQASGVVFCNDNRVTQILASVYTDPRGTPRAEVMIETASATLEEPLWMRCAREAGWAPATVMTKEDIDARRDALAQHDWAAHEHLWRSDITRGPTGRVCDCGATQ